MSASDDPWDLQGSHSSSEDGPNISSPLASALASKIVPAPRREHDFHLQHPGLFCHFWPSSSRWLSWLPFGCSWGLSWPHFGCSWLLLGVSWGSFGFLLGALGARCLVIWVPPAALWGTLSIIVAGMWCYLGCVGVRSASPGVDVECLAFLLDGIRAVFPFPSVACGCFRGREEREREKRERERERQRERG